MDDKILLTTIGIALLSGLLIGLERQYHHKTAGIRTHTLVAVGASIFVLISNEIHLGNSNVDLTRVVGQVVVGVGFLGAGVIMRQGTNIQGLNSAATIWCSAALGCMAGLGWYCESIILSVIIVSINFFGRKLEDLKIFQNKLEN